MRQLDDNIHRTCDSKVRHVTYWGAYIALRKSQIELNDPTLDIYACRICRGYHIGHSPLGDRIAKRVAIMKERDVAKNRIRSAQGNLRKIEPQIKHLKHNLASTKKQSKAEEYAVQIARLEASRNKQLANIAEWQKYVQHCTDELDKT